MRQTQNFEDTIVALATPPGVGALGIIRLSGKKAIEIADIVFWGKKLAKQPSHTIHFGQIKDADGQVLDEALAFLFKGPHSYTGEDVVEFSCHGSFYILQEVLELLVDKGARLAKPGEFTLRAFVNGRLDLSQAEAVADLVASRSEKAHALALRQLRGGISNEISDLRQQLIDFASLLELELDFSEEDVEFADRENLKILVNTVLKVVNSLIQSFHLGNAIKRGVNTVIAGRPNAGKSTLLNALLKEDRAIVSHIAGTTRDTIEEILNINGIEFRLIDTAGIREAHDQIEAIGVEKTMQKIAESSVVMYIFDQSEMGPMEVINDLEKLEIQNIPILVIANKEDLFQSTVHSPQFRPTGESRTERIERRDLSPQPSVRKDQADWLRLVNTYRTVRISALERQGIEEVKDSLYHTAIQQSIPSDQTIVSNARHYAALQMTLEGLQAVLSGMQTGLSTDLIALDLRQALHYLGEITGEVTTDEILGNIFGKFCIGK